MADEVRLVLTLPADRMVSRRHARLEADGVRVVLVDLASANGTWVGDDRIDRRWLDSTDVVTLGESTVSWAFVDHQPPVADLLGAWERALCLVVERQDAPVEDGSAAPFAGDTLDGLLDTELAELAARTTAVRAPERDPGWFAAEVAALRSRPDHATARRATAAARAAAGSPGADAACRFFRADDRRVLAVVRAALRTGVEAFGTPEPSVVEQGEVLMTALARTLAAVGEYDRRVVAHARATGLDAAAVEVPATTPPVSASRGPASPVPAR